MPVLTRDAILSISDISVKKVTIPETIPMWGGNDVYIRQLTRGQQDQYLKRQYGETRMRQDARAKNQEITSVNIYGHDAWLCVQGVCDEKGAAMFRDADIETLNKKSGEAIGWLAAQIVEFSGMAADAKVARGEVSAEEALRDEVKN